MGTTSRKTGLEVLCTSVYNTKAHEKDHGPLFAITGQCTCFRQRREAAYLLISHLDLLHSALCHLPSALCILHSAFCTWGCEMRCIDTTTHPARNGAALSALSISSLPSQWRLMMNYLSQSSLYNSVLKLPTCCPLRFHCAFCRAANEDRPGSFTISEASNKA